ncbi:MAG TPA: hypothetical protein VLD37_00375 [Candidatus Bilamarchaeum sp.]|nr:hypothetical protein [Candidatus Bilamarchaeum sp.]
MKVLVFGLENEDEILARLRKEFPSVGFKKCRIRDNLEEEGRDVIALDSVAGIDKVILMDELGSVSPKVLEGSETLVTLRILLSIGSLDSAKVIAVPISEPPESAFRQIRSILPDLMAP